MACRWMIVLALAGTLAAASSASSALSVTQPSASTIVEAGDDFATQVLGNAWDMSDSIDIDTEESQNVTSQAFSSGVFSASSTTNDPSIRPLFEGYASSINLSRGGNFPIDTSLYRYVTVKIQLNSSQPAQVFFFQHAGSTSEGTFGFTNFKSLTANQTAIITFDMIADINSSSPHQWTEFPTVGGLRIDPAPASGVNFSIDWIRLTAPATSGQKTTVQWTDSGFAGSYNVSVVDSGGVSYALGATAAGVTSFVADLSFLAPGPYTIHVARGDNSASANSATFAINSPPQITMTAPSVAGDLTQDFATATVGNAWGPFSATDFSVAPLNFKNVVYNNPAGSFDFYGRPTSNDPGWFFNLGGHTIDTSIYRSLCFDLEVFGPRNVGLGSVARIFWGNSIGLLTTSDDIILDDNAADTAVGKYCIKDLAASFVIDPTVAQNGGTWTGTKSVFRIDPDEFTPPGGCSTPDACHDVRLDSVTLAPFAQANPSYNFQWTLADADNASETVAIYLDPDANPSNGNEILIHSAVAATGSGSFTWPGSTSVNYGTYNVLVVADDGVNSVSQYAGGPLIVGARDGIFRNGFDNP